LFDILEVEDSGGKWFIEHLYEGIVILTGQTPYPSNHISLIPNIQTFVNYGQTWDYIPNISVCQLHFVPKLYDKNLQICTINKRKPL